MQNTHIKKNTILVNPIYYKIKDFLLKNAIAIEEEATRQHIKLIGPHNLRRSFLEKYKKNHAQMVKEIAHYLVIDDLKKAITFFNKLGEELAKKSVADKLTIEEASNGSIFLKQALWKKVEASGLLKDLSNKDLYNLIQTIGTFIDTIGSKLSFAYHENYIKSIEIEQKRLDTESKNADVIQKRLAAIVESSDDAIISKSIDGFITSWNKGAEQLYGYKPKEVIGQPVSMLMPPGKKSDFPKIMKILQNGKKVEHYETRRQTKDGRILDVSITVSPIRNTDGKIIGASKVARDITERKLIEKRQNFLEEVSIILGTSIDYETTLKNVIKLIIPFLADYCRIVVLDENKQIKDIAVNHIDHKKLNLIKDLYLAYKNDNSDSGVGKILKTGKSELISAINLEILKNSNTKVISLVKKINLQSYMGIPMKIGNRIVGAIIFSSVRKNRHYTNDDVFLAEELARRAALAIENAQLYEESQKAIALRDEFISVASHELKTPLTSLKMYLQVAKKTLVDNGNDAKNFIKMDNQINKLTLLIQDLLNVSKFQAGKLEYRDTEFDLHGVVDEVIENIQPSTTKHLIELDGTLKKNVWGDRDRISQVLTNLLTNAIKYSPQADKVIIRLSPEKFVAKVSVEDFGIGIEQHHIHKLFERFYRVSDPQEKTFPGLGLGLYISNEIVKRYGGKMSVSSNKGKGSQFSFTLPYKQKMINNVPKVTQKIVSI